MSMNSYSSSQLRERAAATYSAGAVEDTRRWIQTDLWKFETVRAAPDLVDGLYVRVVSAAVPVAIAPDLQVEFEAWDTLSDEALELFETSLG